MALCKLERRNYGGKWPMSIKYQNLHSFKEGLILLYQGILEARRIAHLHGSAHFSIPLRTPLDGCFWKIGRIVYTMKFNFSTVAEQLC